MSALDPERLVKIGGYANDGTGDDLRTAFNKVNSLFSELYITGAVDNASNVGTDGAGIFKEKVANNLHFKKLTSSNNSIQFGENENTVDLTSFANVVEDTSPQLGGNLDLNNFNITGVGNIGEPYTSEGRDRIKINGIKILDLVAVIDMMLWSNTADINLGTVLEPVGGEGPYSGINLDLGTVLSPSHIQLNFGYIIP
jgi:hypothetical protein